MLGNPNGAAIGELQAAAVMPWRTGGIESRITSADPAAGARD